MSRTLATIAAFCVLTWALSLADFALRALWPSVVALALVFITRKALLGLLAGAAAGALLLSAGNPWQAWLALGRDHFAPHFSSSWKLGAIAFTLILGGFAGMLEKGGGLEGLVNRALKRARDPSRGLQGGVIGLGLVCFFDGLANSLLVGRLSRQYAARCGVSRVKLAYLTDSTSSAVACVAFVSTWIAYQLSMIQDGFAQLGQEVNPYLYFVRSVPYNFYCWLTLLLLALAVWRRYLPGPMRAYEDEAVRSASASIEVQPARAPLFSALLPLIVLLLTLFVGFYVFGLEKSVTAGTASYFPVTSAKIAEAFGSDAGPFVLVMAGVVATVVGLMVYPFKTAGTGPVHAFGEGARGMLQPVFILVAAWMLSSTLKALGAGDVISALAGEHVPAMFIPLLIFLTGALISFTTGTSWGTMGILMPLAIPIVAGHPGLAEAGMQEAYYAAVIGAVFSGAVFGDHCSPISDTTIVSSIACGVEPADHVRTQMPYALLAATVAALAGFLPVGLGLPGWLGLLAGALVLAVFVVWSTRGRTYPVD